jgi:hypothetical protein
LGFGPMHETFPSGNVHELCFPFGKSRDAAQAALTLPRMLKPVGCRDEGGPSLGQLHEYEESD